MNEIFLDTETTGLSVNNKDRMVEIACIETNDLTPTKRIFHKMHVQQMLVHQCKIQSDPSYVEQLELYQERMSEWRWWWWWWWRRWWRRWWRWNRNWLETTKQAEQLSLYACQTHESYQACSDASSSSSSSSSDHSLYHSLSYFLMKFFFVEKLQDPVLSLAFYF